MDHICVALLTDKQLVIAIDGDPTYIFLIRHSSCLDHPLPPDNTEQRSHIRKESESVH